MNIIKGIEKAAKGSQSSHRVCYISFVKIEKASNKVVAVVKNFKTIFSNRFFTET